MPKDKPKISDFGSYNDAAEYLENSKEFSNWTPVKRMQQLDLLKNQFQQGEMKKVVPKEVVDNAKKQDEGRGWGQKARELLSSGMHDFRQELIDVSDKTGDPGNIGAILRMLPDSNTQAAIDVVTLIAPEAKMGEVINEGIAQLPRFAKPIARLGARVLPATVAGAIGGATEGSPKMGAAQGAAESLGNEVVSGVFKRGRQTIRDLDFQALSGWVEKHLGRSAGFKNLSQFNDKIMSGKVMNNITEEGSDLVDRIVKDAKKKKVNFDITIDPDQTGVQATGKMIQKMEWPYVNKQGAIHDISVDFPEATKKLDALDELGWQYLGNPKMTKEGEIARSLAIQMEESIAEQMEKKLGRGPATEWLTNKYRQRAGRTITSLLREARLKGGSWGDLQELASGKYLGDLQTNLGVDAKTVTGAKDANELLSALRVDNTTVGPRAFAPPMDEPGNFKPYVRVHTGFGLPSMGVHPKTPYHSGNLPYDLGRDRAMTAALIMGPYRAVQFAKDYLTSRDEQDQQPNAEPNAEATPNAAMR